MNNLPIETYESVVQQRDALAAENVALKLAFEKPQAYLSWHAIPPTWEDPLPCGEYLDVHDTEGHKNSDGTDCWPVFAKPDIETPVTDVFTREMMAKGVESGAEHFKSRARCARGLGYHDRACFLDTTAEMFDDFAAQLRKGINDAQ